MLWGWVQERRAVHVAAYSGCVSSPRLLCLAGPPGRPRLVQLPLPELKALRSGASWSAAGLSLLPGEPLPLPVVTGARAHVPAAACVPRLVVAEAKPQSS